MSEFKEYMAELLQTHSIEFSEQQLEQLDGYYQLLVSENKKYNLTTITQPKEAAELHFFDSLVPMKAIPMHRRMIDVGSGGGFPAAPLKIMRPDLDVTALESTGKKCNFIKEAAQKVGIELEVLQMRAEDAAHSKHREKYDVCVSRAVADLPILMELCSGLIRKGGLFIAYKGGSAEEEMQRAGRAASILGLRQREIIETLLPEYEHKALVYTKTKGADSSYPRNYAQIRKNPL